MANHSEVNGWNEPEHGMNGYSYRVMPTFLYPDKLLRNLLPFPPLFLPDIVTKNQS